MHGGVDRVDPDHRAGPWPCLVAFLIVMVGLGVVAARNDHLVSRRSVVFCTVMFLLYAAGARLAWLPAVTTLPVCTIPLAVLWILRCRLSADATPWLTLGRRPDLSVVILAAVTVLVAAAALTLRALLLRPDPGPFLAQVPGRPLWLALLGIVAFALVGVRVGNSVLSSRVVRARRSRAGSRRRPPGRPRRQAGDSR